MHITKYAKYFNMIFEILTNSGYLKTSEDSSFRADTAVRGSLLPSAGYIWYLLSVSLMLTCRDHMVAADRRWSPLTVINVIF